MNEVDPKVSSLRGFVFVATAIRTRCTSFKLRVRCSKVSEVMVVGNATIVFQVGA